MRTLIGFLLGLNSEGDDTTSRVSLSDIESRLRSLTADAQSSVAAKKTSVLGGASLAVVGLLAAAYLRGRYRGRRQSTVLEIRRV